jgi:hypothetical protein
MATIDVSSSVLPVDGKFNTPEFQLCPQTTFDTGNLYNLPLVHMRNFRGMYRGVMLFLNFSAKTAAPTIDVTFKGRMGIEGSTNVSWTSMHKSSLIAQISNPAIPSWYQLTFGPDYTSDVTEIAKQFVRAPLPDRFIFRLNIGGAGADITLGAVACLLP